MDSPWIPLGFPAGNLWAALAGIIIMVCFWIVLLMRLAATHDVLRVKYRLQKWLIEAGGCWGGWRGSGGQVCVLALCGVMRSGQSEG